MKAICLLVVILAGATPIFAADDAISLAGKWRFELDRADSGISDKWFDRSLAQNIRLPGSLPELGIGDDVTLETQWTGSVNDRSYFDSPRFAKDREPGHIRIPFWLQPEKVYAGVAWFQREINVSAGWKQRRTILFLERPHWETRVWIDSRLVGTNDSLATPHEYDLGQLTPGRHVLSIRVDNRRIVEIGENSHAITDHTQGNWNGIVGAIELRSTPPVWIEEVRIYPNVAAKRAIVVVVATNSTGEPFKGKLSLFFENKGKALRPPISKNFNTTEPDLTTEEVVELGTNAPLWDEFTPAMLNLRAELRGELAGVPIRDQSRANFGLREISTDGTQFEINGRKTFIRGTLECCIFSKTGHPPTDVDEWKRIMRVAQSHGLNLLRFHSYCPPEAAFDAADELGMYLQVETCWANQSATIGDGNPVDQWVYRETERILKNYGNHPSFILMPYGNEPGGKNVAPYLAKYVEHFKAMDSRRLWTGGSGWPQLPENQFHITPDPRIQAWGSGINSRINSKPPETVTDYLDYISQRSVPVISHEIGQWCVYPNFDEIPEYTGYLKPRNFEIFRDFLNANGMGNLSRQFLLASGKLQTLCYKEDIESALRTPGMGGFELLDLHDFPGQGTALVGVLDPFWREKGYVTAREFSRFCNRMVPLARLSKRVFTTDETLTARLELAHFDREPIQGAVTRWKLTKEGRTLAEGKLPVRNIPIGNGISLGDVAIDLKKIPAPAHCRLIVSVAGAENDWDIWIYPTKAVSVPTDVLVTSHLDATARVRLQNGGKVLLTIPGQEVRNYDSDPVKVGFSSIFWNTAWTKRQAPTTLGILCDPAQPALAKFPTDFHSDWQWWYLIHRAGALRLDLLPQDVGPIVRVIDDWVTAHPLALITEAKIGKGRIVVCGFDLTNDAADPVSRQILRSLLDYMESPKFTPRTECTLDQIQSLAIPLATDSPSDIAQINADSEQEGYEAKNAIDGDPQTFWHSSWAEGARGFPHEVTIELSSAKKIAGITALPRQDGNQNGWIKDYILYTSMDGTNWGDPVAHGAFSKNPKIKTVKFPPTNARFIKLVAQSGYADGPWASLAEFHVIGENQN